MILDTAKRYYENDKERLRDKARDKYRGLSEEEEKKKIKIKYERNRYRNMAKEKKQKLEEYQKSYREAKKSQFSDL